MHTAALSFAAFLATAVPAAQADILNEAVEFPIQILFLSHDVPGMVVGVVHQGRTAVYGFGSISKEVERVPDGNTALIIGSITKTFTGLGLAHLAAEGRVDLTDPLTEYLPDLPIPQQDSHPIRLVDLATHASGLKRELDETEDIDKYSLENYERNLAADELMFVPGTGVSYSNLGFDLLGMALAEAAGAQTFAEVLVPRVLEPLGLVNTQYGATDAQRGNMMVGHLWTGEPVPERVTADLNQGASSLVTTTDDMLRYIQWNLDRFGGEAPEARQLAQAAHLIRGGLAPILGMDESGHMNAMGLGWVIMMPEGDRPLILQKAGGAEGVFSYLAFAPHHGTGMFIAINEFDFDLSMRMAEVVNEIIATLAPR